ncbi:MAG: PAS domain S-box protein, partial [Nitrospinales bacterium]
FAIWVTAILCFVHKKHMEKLQDQEAHIESILENMLDGIISMDEEGRVLSFNPAAERILGYEASEVIGNNVNMLMPEPYYSEHDGYVKNYLQTGNAKIIGFGREVEGKRKDGTVFPLNLGVSESVLNGKRIFIGVIQDITEQKRLELEALRSKEELKKANERLEMKIEERMLQWKETNEMLLKEIEERKRMQRSIKHSNMELERSNQDLNDFTAIVSHDLQAPLRKIITFSDRLQEKYSEKLDDTGKDYLDRMDKSTLRMKDYIEDLLKLSRVTSKPITFKPVDLKKVVTEVVSDLEIQVKQTNGAVEILNERPLPTLEADSFQMRQLFQNLISNALKFHKKGEPPIVKIAASTSASDPNSWEIRIEDNGIGFDEKYLERIMKPFERLHPTKAFEGTGLGLAICQRIILRHGGSLNATSSSDVGSAFIIHLPKKQAQKSVEPSDKK